MHSLTLAPHSSSRGCYGHISFKFSFKLIPSKNDEAEVLMFVGFRMVLCTLKDIVYIVCALEYGLDLLANP